MDSKNLSIELYRSKDYQKMPWKNGKGETSQIAIHPREAQFPTDPFHWRISMATLTEDGLFSAFPGYRRYLTVAEGEGLRLREGEHLKDLPLSSPDVYHFSGDMPVSAQLLSGPIKDLGLIYQPTHVKPQFHVVAISKKPRSFQLEAETVWILNLQGRVKVTLYPGEVSQKLERHDSIRVERAEMVLIEPLEAQSKLALIELHPVKSLPV